MKTNKLLKAALVAGMLMTTACGSGEKKKQQMTVQPQHL